MSVIVVVEQELHDMIMSKLAYYRQRIGDGWIGDYGVVSSDFVRVADEVCEAAKAAEKGAKDDK